MIKYIFLFLLPFSLYSSKILSYNIYERTDRVDVMITFDTPYSSVIKKSVGNSTITIKLQNASIESAKLKKLSSKYIKSLSVTPMADYTKIVALVPSTTTLQASKTSDSYGLRLRFLSKNTLKKQVNILDKKVDPKPLSVLPTKKSGELQFSYYIVISILIIGIAILFFIKKRVVPNKTKKDKPSWLFKKSADTKQNTDTQESQDKNVSIRFQKSIDQENSVVMLDFGEQSYLVLMGKSNVLLDKFTDNKPITQDDFETILQDRHKELDDFLQHDEEPSKEPLQAYKERAASIAYDV
jgi:hypothetical protein